MRVLREANTNLKISEKSKKDSTASTRFWNGHRLKSGSISTIIIAILAAFGLMYASPELFTSPYVAFVTAYTAPQIVDGVITSGARNFMEVAEEKDTSYEEEEIVFRKA